MTKTTKRSSSGDASGSNLSRTFRIQIKRQSGKETYTMLISSGEEVRLGEGLNWGKLSRVENIVEDWKW